MSGLKRGIFAFLGMVLLLCSLAVGLIMWALKPLSDPTLPNWPILSAVLVFEFRCDTALALLDVAHDTGDQRVADRLSELEKFQHHCEQRPPARSLTGLADIYRQTLDLPVDALPLSQRLQRLWQPGWRGHVAMRDELIAKISSIYKQARIINPDLLGVYSASKAALHYARCDYALVEGPAAVHYRIRRFLTAVEWGDHPRDFRLKDWEARHDECAISSGLPVDVDVSFYDHAIAKEETLINDLYLCQKNGTCASALEAAREMSSVGE